MKTIQIQDDLHFYEVEGLTFHKFNNLEDILKFIETNKIEDRTEQEYPIHDLLDSYGTAFYVYDEEDNTHAFLIADDETHQNYEIRYDHDEETFYVVNIPAFWGKGYEDTLTWALDTFDIKKREVA